MSLSPCSWLHAFVQTLKTELKKVCSGAEVTERPGHVEVAGEYRGPIKLWLLGLGF